eukprot:scaffold137322_cov20-Tisochrysis_lutea.AAC.1
MALGPTLTGVPSTLRTCKQVRTQFLCALQCQHLSFFCVKIQCGVATSFPFLHPGTHSGRKKLPVKKLVDNFDASYSYVANEARAVCTLTVNVPASLRLGHKCCAKAAL